MITMSSVTSKPVLLIEDEPDIADVLTLHLEDLGATVTHATDGTTGLTEAIRGEWCLIMLDLSLPGLDGLDICRQVRRVNPRVPIMMLTARSTEQDCITGLDCGADHYLTKPFSVAELRARFRAIFRRDEDNASSTTDASDNAERAASTTFAVNDITLSPDSHQVFVQGTEVALTAREFDLLLHFVRSPGQVFSRHQLLNDVWGYSHQGYLHTVNSHINRLRSKIEPDPSQPHYIQTVWGVGYKLSA